MLTIVTTTKDNITDLKATASSIYHQSDKSFSWLIYDGSTKCSNDEYEPFLNRSNREGIDSSFEHAIDGGVYAAMNSAIKFVNTEYVLFLNCGDMLYNRNSVKDLLKILEQSSPDVYHTSNVYVDTTYNLHLQKGSHSEEMRTILKDGIKPYYPLMVCQQAIVYKTSVLREHPLDTTIKIAADHSHFLNLLEKNFSLYYGNVPLSIYFGGGFSWKYGYHCHADWFFNNLSHTQSPTQELIDFYLNSMSDFAANNELN
ncbi:hypothetical protein OA162_03215 [Synechococcus sp. AH-736-A19]|nr:hypothetical protein [Synechococcus sp. AH-736-A19]